MSSAKTGRASEGKPVYPACAYTKQQLKEMLSVLGEWASRYGYTVPESCRAVLSGASLGGTDAMPAFRNNETNRHH